jgi:hypothetical protein
MSLITSLAELMTMPVPAWVALLAIAGLYTVQQVTVARRIDSHARILGHMDRWANSVEARLEALGQGMEQAPPPARRPARPQPKGRERPTSSRSLSPDQVRDLISRLVDTRAA